MPVSTVEATATHRPLRADHATRSFDLPPTAGSVTRSESDRRHRVLPPASTDRRLGGSRALTGSTLGGATVQNGTAGAGRQNAPPRSIRQRRDNSTAVAVIGADSFISAIVQNSGMGRCGTDR